MAEGVGTRSENLLRYLSGSVDKKVYLHLCEKPCKNLVWEDGVIHVEKAVKKAGEPEAWMSNCKEMGGAPPGADELGALRRDAELLAEEEEKEDGKEKKSKKEKKEARKEKKEGGEGGKEKKSKKNLKGLKIRAKKGQEEVFSSTVTRIQKFEIISERGQRPSRRRQRRGGRRSQRRQAPAQQKREPRRRGRREDGGHRGPFVWREERSQEGGERGPRGSRGGMAAGSSGVPPNIPGVDLGYEPREIAASSRAVLQIPTSAEDDGASPQRVPDVVRGPGFGNSGPGGRGIGRFSPTPEIADINPCWSSLLRESTIRDPPSRTHSSCISPGNAGGSSRSPRRAKSLWRSSSTQQTVHSHIGQGEKEARAKARATRERKEKERIRRERRSPKGATMERQRSEGRCRGSKGNSCGGRK